MAVVGGGEVRRIAGEAFPMLPLFNNKTSMK